MEMKKLMFELLEIESSVMYNLEYDNRKNDPLIEVTFFNSNKNCFTVFIYNRHDDEMRKKKMDFIKKAIKDDDYFKSEKEALRFRC